MSPTTKKSHLDPNAMLDAAEALFAENGFGSCSLRDVMTACGVSTTAFYARFDGKEQIFDEVIARFIEELREGAAETIASAPTMAEGLRDGVASFVETVRSRKKLVAVILSEGASTDGTRERMKQSYGLLARLIAPQFRRTDAERAEARAWALVGAIEMQVFRWAVLGDIPDDELHGEVLAAASCVVMSAG